MDSDIFFIFSAVNLIGKIAKVFNINNLSDIYIPKGEIKSKILSKNNLRNLDFQLEHKAFLKKYKQEIEKLSPIPTKNPNNLMNKLTQIDDFDRGETRLLFFADCLYQQGEDFILCSGDKKWMKQLPDLKDDKIKSYMIELLKGKVICLESLIMKLKSSNNDMFQLLQSYAQETKHNTLTNITTNKFNFDRTLHTYFENLKNESVPDIFYEI